MDFRYRVAIFEIIEALFVGSMSLIILSDLLEWSRDGLLSACVMSLVCYWVVKGNRTSRRRIGSHFYYPPWFFSAIKGFLYAYSAFVMKTMYGAPVLSSMLFTAGFLHVPLVVFRDR